jgi:hypothetical protein
MSSRRGTGRARLGGPVNIRAILRTLSVTACVVAAAALTTGQASAANTLDRFTAAGVQIDQLAPGWTVAGDRLQWAGGDVSILTTGVDLGGGPCPSGYVCMFENDDLQGTMWYSNDRNRYHYMSNLGFNNVMSSWQNRSSYDARWYFNTSGTPNPNYCMGSGLRSEHPAPGQNDQASAVYIYSSSTVC